jgi:glycerophosphoryl diester phosphodiesterase
MILAALSLGCLSLAVLAFARAGRGRAMRVALPVGLALAAVMLLTWLGLNAITGKGINDAVVYHLHTGLGGGDVSEYGWLIGASLAGLGVLLAGCAWLYRALPQGRHPRLWGDAATGALLLAALGANPFAVDLTRTLARQHLIPQQTQGFSDPRILTRPETRRNLIFIYLESLERSYFDQAAFPGLITDLRAIEAQGRSYTALGQSIGAGFTIGGMVAGQCGVPLILSGSENSMQVSNFLTGATCLGDLLEQEGYRTEYMGGSAREFAGKGSFYESHGFDRVLGLEDLKPGLEDPAYVGPWGLQDDTLFALARKRIDDLAAGPDPFALVMLTLDTHHPDGHANTNRACTDVSYGDGSNAMLTSVRCADRLAARFVQDLLASPLAKDTVIVLASDHLAMVNGASAQLEQADRSNLFVVLEPGVPPALVARKGTTLDVGPTVMAALGYDVGQMGFGVNLSGDRPTLAETRPEDATSDLFEDYLPGFQAVYDRLWDYPKVNDGFYANIEAGLVQFGAASFRVPALMRMDATGGISGVTLDDPLSDRALSRLALDLPGDEALLWVDDCARLAPLGDGAAAQGLCLGAGALGTDGFRVLPLPRSGFIARADVLPDTPPTPDPALLEARQAVLGATLVAEGNLPLDVALPAPGFTGRDVLWRSSAAGRGASFGRLTTSDSLDAGADLLLARGLTLIGVAADGALTRLAHVDSCQPGTAPVAPFQPAMTGHLFYAIVAHDSAICDAGRAALQAAVAGLDLPLIGGLGFRQPYVALLGPDGATERLGPPGGRLLIRVGTATTSAPLPEAHPAPPAPVAKAPPTQPAPTAPPAPTPACMAPPETPAPGPDPLPLDTPVLLTGAAASSLVATPLGWWQPEEAGRWIGADRAEMVLRLPGTGGRLSIEGVPYRKAETPVQVWAGDRRLAEATLAEGRPIGVDLSGLPADTPVTLTLVFPDTRLRCPKAEGTAPDPRALVAMIRSVTLTGQSPAALPACLPPPAPRRSLPEKGLPIDAETALGQTAHFGFGDGWWATEPFGRWIGAASAELTLILPQEKRPLELELSGSTFAGVPVPVELRYRERLLFSGLFGADRPIVIPVGDLPRGQPLALHLGFPDTAPDCPAATGASQDDRALVALLGAVTLRPAPATLPPVAHAGGSFGQTSVTNSLDALNANSPYYDLFEIDLSWTADGSLVCLHDWQESFAYRFGFTPDAPLTLARFRALVAETAPDRPENCTLDTLMGWLRNNPGKRIVTDLKDENLAGLRLIARSSPDLLARILPQAYQPDEIAQIRALGFSDVIWTLYRYGGDDSAVLAALEGQSLFALTMPEVRVATGLARRVLDQTGIRSYVHTVNDPAVARCHAQAGVAGLYTDRLRGAMPLGDGAGDGADCGAANG